MPATGALIGTPASIRANEPEQTEAMLAEQSVIYFCDHYGYPAVLRALATAIEQPINPSAPLVGD